MSNDEIDEELEFHLEMLTERYLAEGMGPNDAREAARRRLGDPDRVKANCRSVSQHAQRASRALPPPNRTPFSAAWTTLVVLIVLVFTTYAQDILRLAPFYGRLYRLYPFTVPETLKNALEVGVCVGALWLCHRLRLRDVGRELGLAAPVLPALLFGLAASSPMWIGFALTRAAQGLSIPSTVYLTVVSPFTEEVAMRGYAFRQLSRRAGLPFWASALPVALFAGLGHIEKGQTAAEILGLFVLIGSGATVFCWLLMRWDSLWFPFALHFAMNCSWQVFKVARTAIGGWFPFAVQSLTILFAVAITLRFTKRPAASDGQLEPVTGDAKRTPPGVHGASFATAR